jgi:hypothetical protein
LLTDSKKVHVLLVWFNTLWNERKYGNSVGPVKNIILYANMNMCNENFVFWWKLFIFKVCQIQIHVKVETWQKKLIKSFENYMWSYIATNCRQVLCKCVLWTILQILLIQWTINKRQTKFQRHRSDFISFFPRFYFYVGLNWWTLKMISVF